MAELAFAGVGDQGGSPAIAANGANSYFALNGKWLAADTQAHASVPWRGAAATAKAFYAYLTTNTTSAGGAFGLAVNGGSSVSVSVPAATTGGFSDIGSTLSVAAGDPVAFFVTAATGTGSLQASGVSCAFETATQATAPTGAYGPNALSVTGNTNQFFAFPTFTTTRVTTESDVYQTALESCSLSNLRVEVTANSRTASSTFTTRKNGANGGVSVSVPTVTTGVFEDTTHSDSLVAGDTFNGCVVPGGASGSAALTFSNVSLKYASTTTRRTGLFAGTANASPIAFAAGVTRFIPIVGRYSNSGTATAADAAVPLPFSGLVAGFGLRVSANAASTTGVLTLQKNTVDTADTISVTSATTGWLTNLSPAATFSAGDRLGLKWVNGATSTTSIAGASVVVEANLVASGRQRRALVY